MVRMRKARYSRQLLPVAFALLLLAALVFLFAKTIATDYKSDAHALSLLRELRDLDLRLDADAARLAGNLRERELAATDRSIVLTRIFQELEHGSARGTTGAQVPALRAGMNEKQVAFRTLQGAHARSLDALRNLREALAAMVTSTTGLKARNPESAGMAPALLAMVEDARAALRGGDIESFPETERAVSARIAALVPAAFAAGAQLGAPAKAVEGAAREFLEVRATELAAWRKFSFYTVGSKIELTAHTLAKSIESALDEKDRWRVYLLAYATALLIGMAYLGMRVAATQAQLRDANLLLEKRVAERTRELERTLAKLKESEAQLVQTEKMSSLGQLVAGVAHEINTPLAYVKNGVASVRDRLAQLREALAHSQRLVLLLQSPSPGAAELAGAREALGDCLARLADHQVLADLESLTRDGLHGIEQISELVGNLRNFSRLDRGKVASFNVNEGVRATLLIAKPALRKVDVETRLGDIPSITCAPSQVNQVLLNLVTNASQAIDKPRGRISISTRREGVDYVAIEVADNGRGIAPEAIARVFDPFYTTKEVGKGTGLGLSIAYKIVTDHGGRIDVRSVLGNGSTFTVTLPVRQPAEFSGAEARSETLAA